MPRHVRYEVREEFFGLVCSGVPMRVAAGRVGVSETSAGAWWRASGLMEPAIQIGKRGGLPGTAPPRVPGEHGPDGPDGSGGSGGPQRQRRPLTSEDRSVIAAGRRMRLSYAEIAKMIGRDKSVVCREVVRNTGPDGSYWGPVAHRAAHERRRRPKAFKLVQIPGLCRRIEGWMAEGWSPKLIASVLRKDHPDSRMDRVSHETIYQALYVQTRGQLRAGLRADLHKQLSLKRAQRKSRGTSRQGSTRYCEAFKISQRPPEVDDRAVPGHWEGDLILGTGCGSAVGTLVERSTRFTILLHLPARHDAASVAEAMIQQMSKLPEHLRRSITWDRGVELADYERIQLELATTVYFCDPYSPWQRGSNENTNRLLRFWLQKSTDLSVHTATDLQRIADTLNRRPRPTLDLQTPAQRLHALLTQAA